MSDSMSDDTVPTDDAAAARLEAALDRIAAAARPAPAAAPVEYAVAAQHQAAAELDALIARLRTRLGDLGATGHSDPSGPPAMGPDEDEH